MNLVLAEAIAFVVLLASVHHAHVNQDLLVIHHIVDQNVLQAANAFNTKPVSIKSAEIHAKELVV